MTLSIKKILKQNSNTNIVSTSSVGGPATLAECALLLKQQGAAVAVLAVQDLQAYWLRLMSDPNTSSKDKLTASKLYAESIGAFDKSVTSAKGPAVYHWGGVVDAQIVKNDSSENGEK